MENELLGKLAEQECSVAKAAAAPVVTGDKVRVEATPVSPDDTGIDQYAMNISEESPFDGNSHNDSVETSKKLREKFDYMFENMGVLMAMQQVGQAAGMEWAHVNRDNPEILEYASRRALPSCDSTDYTVGGVCKDEVLGEYFWRQLRFAPYLHFDENADESEVLPQEALWWIYGWQDGAEMGLRFLESIITK